MAAVDQLSRKRHLISEYLQKSRRGVFALIRPRRCARGGPRAALPNPTLLFESGIHLTGLFSRAAQDGARYGVAICLVSLDLTAPWSSSVFRLTPCTVPPHLRPGEAARQSRAIAARPHRGGHFMGVSSRAVPFTVVPSLGQALRALSVVCVGAALFQPVPASAGPGGPGTPAPGPSAPAPAVSLAKAADDPDPQQQQVTVAVTDPFVDFFRKTEISGDRRHLLHLQLQRAADRHLHAAPQLRREAQPVQRLADGVGVQQGHDRRRPDRVPVRPAVRADGAGLQHRPARQQQPAERAAGLRQLPGAGGQGADLRGRQVGDADRQRADRGASEQQLLARAALPVRALLPRRGARVLPGAREVHPRRHVRERVERHRRQQLRQDVRRQHHLGADARRSPSSRTSCSGPEQTDNADDSRTYSDTNLAFGFRQVHDRR